ncbi:MAG: hypothetical protein PHV61_11060 [Limnochordia bacterium]|jgi:hypothetical protein|nr:hypothetical protein [Limnochordia bacterium]
MVVVDPTSLILSIVASEQAYLASILSTEAVKAEMAASMIGILDFEDEAAASPNLVLDKALRIEKSVASVIRAAADKEIAIAAKVSAVMGNPLCGIKWITCCDTNDC